ncbi:MAG: iron-sulfur cluster assembly scaffold protein [Beijerinckiaceae bacterium]|nr:iron-sulfur cluster assembly scaffold protein [Beijerinckiaceae bacterium]MCI0600117.1 iron-sulfur cluster assembly scaffold protein [Beijerinckiaceae bacterium]MCI0736808.1 iron-sulfur cluster assembly scaffold protein [Beijerinckiaceae bacterium]
MPSETDFFSVYSHQLLDLAANIPRQGRLAAPCATSKAHSKLCGSTIIVDLVMEEGRVADFAHDVKACALGQAAASIMARNVIGASGPELRDLRDQMRAMLKENGPPPRGKWADFAILEPVRDFKARHASTLLTFDATVDCVNQLEAAASGARDSDSARAIA